MAVIANPLIDVVTRVEHPGVDCPGLGDKGLLWAGQEKLLDHGTQRALFTWLDELGFDRNKVHMVEQDAQRDVYWVSWYQRRDPGREPW